VEQTLLEHGLRAKAVDIDAEPELREKFNTCVPVVEIDGKVRFRGKVDPILLRRLISSGD
jgi:predicted thioredoxin/glutaredoxin